MPYINYRHIKNNYPNIYPRLMEFRKSHLELFGAEFFDSYLKSEGYDNNLPIWIHNFKKLEKKLDGQKSQLKMF